MRIRFFGFFVAVLGLLLAQSAFAADLPTKMPVKSEMAPVVPWTGFYVNGGVGYGLWAADQTLVSPTTGLCGQCATQVQGGKGWLGTIGAGYDYQFTDKIVAGVLGDASIASLKGTIQDSNPFDAGNFKETSSWAIGGRIGWLVTPKTLSYWNGGYSGARFSAANMFKTSAGAPTAFSTPATTFNGWFLGGGIETSLAPNWFWRTEYRYAYYGSKTLPDTNGSGGVNESFVIKPTVQTVTSQIVYKFNGGLPAPVYPATPEKATNWTGVYANAGIGYGVWAADTTTVNPTTGACVLCATQVQGGKGWQGVVGAGYDWQFAPVWVAGVLGEYDISSLKGTIQDQGPQWNGNIKQTGAWVGGVRVGWLPSKQTMTYVNGGYAGARFSDATFVSNFSAIATGNTTSGFTRSGWFVGGGVETTVDFFGLLGKGWFWRNEYRYASYGTQSIADTGVSTQNNITFKPVVQTVTSSVVFKFN